MRRASVLILLLAALTTAVVAGGRLERLNAERRSAGELLYLPNGRMLKLASLGQAPVLADLIYLWAIQFYSDYDRADRYRYVEHVFGSVIAELDPHYIDPYWMGALILTVEADDLDGGLRLIDLGFARNPHQWILPYLGAWECYTAGRPELAARYFDKAAGVPDAPPMVLRMRAGMIARAGNIEGAIRLWTEVLDDPRSDAASLAIARRQIRDLRVRADLQMLDAAIERFREENRRAPAQLVELVRGGYIGTVPRDPEGREYQYDRVTGRVGATAGRVLGDSG